MLSVCFLYNFYTLVYWYLTEISMGANASMLEMIFTFADFDIS